MTLKSLVVSFLHVPWTITDQNGIQRRFGAFLRALHRISDDITLLHIVPAGQVAAAGPVDQLSRSQSDFWGVPLRIALAPRRTRQETAWSHYGAGILDVDAQPTLYPYGGEAVEVVAAHLDRQPDLVFAHQLMAMLPVLRSGRRPRRLVFDMDDIEHKLASRRALGAPRHPGKMTKLLHIPALMSLERRCVAASDLAFVCSEADRAHLRRWRFGDAVKVVPNSVALPCNPPGVVQDRTVLFLGNMDQPPNHAAAERMVCRIWPRVRAAVPEARLMIAGWGSDCLPSATAGFSGVEHVGFVEDLAALYAGTRVVCCPLTTGGGTRLKLVEAAAYARPMVSTRLGAEGLDFADGAQALLRDDDAGFAEACVMLLRDDMLCRRLGMGARHVMAASYDAQRVEEQIAEMLKRLEMPQGRVMADAA